MKLMISICLIIVITSIFFCTKRDLEYLNKCKWYRIAKDKANKKDMLECNLDGLGYSSLRVLNSYACCGYTDSKCELCNKCPIRDGIILSGERRVV